MTNTLAACCIIWLVVSALLFTGYYAAVVAGARADRSDEHAAIVRGRLDDIGRGVVVL